VHIRHIPPVRESQYSTHRHHPLRRLIPFQHVLHSADQVHQQIPRHARPVFLPTPPSRKHLRVKRPLRHRSLPGVPIQRLRRQIRRWRIFPSSRRIIPAQRTFHQVQLSNHPLPQHFFRLCTNHRADPLRSNLYNPSGFLRRCHHRYAFLRRV